MDLKYIVLEGADCSGKTTLFEGLHAATNYKYNIQDRSNLSMYIHSKLYGRDDSNTWYKEFWNELKSFKTLYVVLLPEDDVIRDRISKRGDDKQTPDSAVNINNEFRKLCNFHFRDMFPNILVLNIDRNTTVEELIDTICNRIYTVNNTTSPELIKSLVFASGKNELTNISLRRKVFSTKEKLHPIMWQVLNYPPEKEYYDKIRMQMIRKIEKELYGIGGKGVQKTDSRRFIFSGEECISFIHTLFRENELNVKVVMRSSNVYNTLWADYEFLRIICLDIANALNIQKSEIYLDLEIRSAHINP